MERQYSTASWNTVLTLEKLEQDAAEMQQCSDNAEALLLSPPEEGLPLSLRNDLAQLHGNANKLLANHLDAILTSACTRVFERARTRPHRKLWPV